MFQKTMYKIKEYFVVGQKSRKNYNSAISLLNH